MLTTKHWIYYALNNLTSVIFIPAFSWDVLALLCFKLEVTTSKSMIVNVTKKSAYSKLKSQKLWHGLGLVLSHCFSSLHGIHLSFHFLKIPKLDQSHNWKQSPCPCNVDRLMMKLRSQDTCMTEPLLTVCSLLLVIACVMQKYAEAQNILLGPS